MYKFLLTILVISAPCYSGGPFDDCQGIPTDQNIVRILVPEDKDFAYSPNKSAKGGTGTVISINDNSSSSFVLKAWHCIEGIPVDSIWCQSYTYSTHPKLKALKTTVFEKIEVQAVIPHPEACKNLNQVDLAIMVLGAPVRNKIPFLIDPNSFPFEKNKPYFADGFGMTGDLNGDIFKLAHPPSHPLRMNVYCDEKRVSETLEDGTIYENMPFYRSYYVHEKWMANETEREEVLNRYQGLKPSNNFAYKGDSGGPLYDLETNHLLGINTIGRIGDLSDGGSSILNPLTQTMPETYYTILDSDIKGWIIETIQSYGTT